MGLNWLTAVVSALVLSSVNAAPAGNKTSSKASPTNRDFIPMPVGNDFLPDSYSPCAEEGDSCSCNGLVILGTPELNHWSEPAVADSTVNCVSSSFPNTLSDPGHSRQCWCKPRSLANSEDYMNSVPKLSPAYTTVTPGLKWWAANDVQMFGSPQTFDVLSVDTSVRKVTISHIEGSLLTTPQLGQAVNALAAVNGGFHAYGTNVGTITKLRVNGVDVVTENTVTKWDLQNEDVEGVLTIDGSGKVDIVTSLDTSAWVNDYTFLHSGPLLLLNGVRQPLDGKNWVRFFFVFVFFCASLSLLRIVCHETLLLLSLMAMSWSICSKNVFSFS